MRIQIEISSVDCYDKDRRQGKHFVHPISYSSIAIRNQFFPEIRDDWKGVLIPALSWTSFVHEFHWASSLDYNYEQQAAGFSEFGGADQASTREPQFFQRPALALT